MKNKYFKKTHYEHAYGFLKKIHKEVFTKEMISTGSDPSYMEFMETCMRRFSSDNDEASLMNFMNIYFHLYHIKQSGEKFYYLTPNISARLARTTINVDTYFLKSPFREIFVQIEPGLFFINDTDGSKVPVEGFYVYLKDFGEYKQIRIMACSLLSPTPEIPFNDANFYFHAELYPGKLKDQLEKYIETEVEKQREKLKRYDLSKNIDHLGEFATFIFNILLYITSKNSDLTVWNPIDFEKKINNLKSSSKKKKLEQRAQKATSHKFIVIGANVQDKNNDMEQIQKAGGIGNWKLNHKVRVSGHWRAQWYGSKKGNTRYADTIWIDDYEKGPEFSDIISPKFIVK